MKILFVSSGNLKNGINPLVQSQGISLKKNGVEIEFFQINGKGLLNYLKHIPLLKTYIRINNFDIVHAHYGLCGIVAQLARSKEKLVVSFMGDDLIGSVNEIGTYSLFGSWLVWMNKRFIKKFDFVIVKSTQLHNIVNNSRKVILPNGVDLESFYEINKIESRKKLNIDENKKVIIFVSNPNRAEKNYKLAKEAVASLEDENIILKIVFNIDQNDLKYYYSAADILLLSSYHEGSPNVIKEAMACNCPIVSTDVGDVKWIFGNTEGCYLISEKIEDKSKKTQSELIKEASDKILEALEFAQQLGRTNGRERIIELGLDSESVAKKIIKIYNQMLDAKGSE